MTGKNAGVSSSRSLFVVQSLVLIGAVVLLASVFALRASATEAFAAEIRLRTTRAIAAEVLKGQLDEETGIRGFDVSRQRLYLQPYDEARARLPRMLASLHDSLVRDGIAPDAADRVAALNRDWQVHVADPSIAENGDPAVLLKVGKLTVDELRRAIAAVDAEIDARQSAIDEDRQRALDRIGFFTTAIVAALAVLALGFARRQRSLEARLESARLAAVEERVRATEMRAAYEAEKRIADTLQDAIAQRPLPLHPTLRFSATYVPATDEARVGGDWYDAIELPQNRVLFAIGDVTGHGLNAAVTMSRARQALVTSALFDAEPATVLARVNDELLEQNAPMVTAVAGFADAKSYEFVYASAGHPPPVLLEPNRPPRLLEFGGVPLGVVGGATYTTHRIQSVPGAMLVLYTDGAVEHTRDVLEGETILLDSIARAAATPSDDAASVIHQNIFGGHPAGDDVAILTIGFGNDRAGSLRISADDSQTAVNSRIERGTSETVLPIERARARLRGPRPGVVRRERRAS